MGTFAMSTADDYSPSTAIATPRALATLAALPPALIVMGAAALAYTQAPPLVAQMARLLAPPPVAAIKAPEPPIDKAPVATIAPPPAQKTTVAAPATPRVIHTVKRVARIQHVAYVHHETAARPQRRYRPHDPDKEFDTPSPPVHRYTYQAYQRPYQPAYVPLPLPIPIIGGLGGHGGHMFGRLGSFFGRR
jgi:hypothetical protein